MAESNSKPLRCPCGFYGSSETRGLCSKCYNEHLQRKTAEADGTAPTEATSTTVSSHQLSQALGNVVSLPQMAADSLPVTNSSSTETPSSVVQPSDNEEVEKKNITKTESTTEDSISSNDNSTKSSDKISENETTEPSSSNATKRVRENSECDSTTEDDKPLQKNKKRCFTCNCKLQPAIREIGRCKCELVFCQLHRLPEQHDCIFDHKASGRKEAREKMVSPKKHMGTSLKRIDSDS